MKKKCLNYIINAIIFIFISLKENLFYHFMKLQFSKGKIYDRYSFEELTEVQRNQFLVACKNAWGSRHTLFEAIKTAESEQMSWKYFEITDTESQKIVYQTWILADDCGTFFVADTIQEIEIEMTQSCISPMDEDNEELVALSDSIEKAYKEVNEYDGEAFQQYWDAFYQKKDHDTLGKEYWITYFGQFSY